MHVAARPCLRGVVLPYGRNRAGYATVAQEGDHHRLGRTRPPLKNPFPYPKHPNPTPHQIFHLPAHATQAQIKSRYYELVRTHHPDSAHVAHLAANLAHTQFRGIKASYDFLCGRTLSPHPNARPAPSPQNFDPYMHELARRRRAYYASRSRSAQEEDEKPAWAKGWEDFGAPAAERTVWREDGWRERVILAFGVIALLAGLFPTLPTTVAMSFLPASVLNYDFFASSSSSSSDDVKPQAKEEHPPGTTPAFNIPFIDLDLGHRAAVSSLIQAREERKETAAQRRDMMKVRVAEMNASADGAVGDVATNAITSDKENHDLGQQRREHENRPSTSGSGHSMTPNGAATDKDAMHDSATCTDSARGTDAQKSDMTNIPGTASESPSTEAVSPVHLSNKQSKDSAESLSSATRPSL